ncbi:YidB family protein [Peristeroidobacter agariperforans]|uniref:YidB family protein n=1 Tax=Peristeroidobacter agariperforans TaxID=268404 RepID=UPI00101B938B|nr:YidB family protein [Peristeroidobacter agariperforans]
MGLLDSVGGNRRGGGMSPVMVGLMGLLAYRTLKGKGRLADMLGTGASGSAAGAGGALSGGALSGGLKDLIDRFREGGQEEKVQSWVSKGPNKTIDPKELEQSLGDERIEWLVEQTGMPRDQLLAGLSGELPDAIDKLTPNGRIPTDEELSREG